MAEIIEVDALVPDDMEFRFRGGTYTLPGDISVTDTFRMQKLIVALAQAEEAENLPEQERLTLEVEAFLLGLFRLRNPELESLPFGSRGFTVVLGVILTKLGFGVPDENPPPATRTTKPRSRKTSKPSSTSPPS